MSSTFETELKGFSGEAPIFPLPNLVCFPHVLIPLHIFEPRYRKMVFDALQSDRLIAMALLKPPWEPDYQEKSAAIHDVLCVGRITDEELLPDGEYNLVLRGISRARLIREEETAEPYRIGNLQLQHDDYRRMPHGERRRRQRELLEAFRSAFPQTQLERMFQAACEADIPLGGLCDVLAHCLQLEPSMAQRVLDELDISRRSRMVLREIRRLIPVPSGLQSTFPPPFSVN